MSTRPSYNNSRVSEGVNSSANRNGVTNNSRVYNNAGSVRQSYQNSYNNVRSNSSGSSVQRRSNSPSGYYIQSGQPRSGSSRSSSSYSLPSRGSYSSGFSGGSSSGSRLLHHIAADLQDRYQVVPILQDPAQGLRQVVDPQVVVLHQGDRLKH
jgi:hypothetical protein